MCDREFAQKPQVRCASNFIAAKSPTYLAVLFGNQGGPVPSFANNFHQHQKNKTRGTRSKVAG